MLCGMRGLCSCPTCLLSLCLIVLCIPLLCIPLHCALLLGCGAYGWRRRIEGEVPRVLQRLMHQSQACARLIDQAAVPCAPCRRPAVSRTRCLHATACNVDANAADADASVLLGPCGDRDAVAAPSARE